jgi:hypothetical protein
MPAEPTVKLLTAAVAVSPAFATIQNLIAMLVSILYSRMAPNHGRLTDHLDLPFTEAFTAGGSLDVVGVFANTPDSGAYI